MEAGIIEQLDWIVIAVFIVTYAGMALGDIPFLKLDRTGFALLGAIAVVAAGALTPQAAWDAIDLATILLLYSLMVLSAQFRLAGFYTAAANRVAQLASNPRRMLAALIAVSAALSALLANDIVCLAFTPVLVVALPRAGKNPLPFLIALACASNVGSAATIIGNPQNMLIGQSGQLPFGEFLLYCGVPAVLGLFIVYAVIAWMYRNRFEIPVVAAAGDVGRPYQRYQTGKGLVLTGVLIAAFFTPIPREIAALVVAGILLCSRRNATREMLGLVDWHLITLFCGLFVVVEAFRLTGLPERWVADLAAAGYPFSDTGVLTWGSAVLSNLVSNVPAVMLLVDHLPKETHLPWYVLAVASTFAGNLFLLGSIANLIVAEQAAMGGIKLSAKEHAKAGAPITLLTLLLAWAWFALVG